MRVGIEPHAILDQALDYALIISNVMNRGEHQKYTRLQELLRTTFEPLSHHHFCLTHPRTDRRWLRKKYPLDVLANLMNQMLARPVVSELNEQLQQQKERVC